MQKFFLRGLAEGIAGRSVVLAKNSDDVFIQVPELRDIRHKLTIKGNAISGFCACDG
jgi:hypothetical protein